MNESAVSGPTPGIAMKRRHSSLRATILSNLQKLNQEFGISIIYITHDLATAYSISDRIIIMQKGEVVESGDARAVLDHPQHPYAILLKSSVLSPEVATGQATS